MAQVDGGSRTREETGRLQIEARQGIQRARSTLVLLCFYNGTMQGAGLGMGTTGEASGRRGRLDAARCLLGQRASNPARQKTATRLGRHEDDADELHGHGGWRNLADLDGLEVREAAWRRGSAPMEGLGVRTRPGRRGRGRDDGDGRQRRTPRAVVLNFSLASTWFPVRERQRHEREGEGTGRRRRERRQGSGTAC